MRRMVLALTLLAGCVYVTTDEFDQYWDKDGDGWSLDQDCDDENAEIHPYAPDLRGDGCDADCGLEPDEDGDDWPDAADCDPANPDAYPCSELEVDGDGIDHDCDGFDGVRTDPCPAADPDFDNSPEDPCADSGGRGGSG